MIIITRRHADRCITHHCACDCREFRYQQMEDALRVIHSWAGTPADLDPERVRRLCREALGRPAAGEEEGER